MVRLLPIITIWKLEHKRKAPPPPPPIAKSLQQAYRQLWNYRNFLFMISSRDIPWLFQNIFNVHDIILYCLFSMTFPSLSMTRFFPCFSITVGTLSWHSYRVISNTIDKCLLSQQESQHHRRACCPAAGHSLREVYTLGSLRTKINIH